MYSKITNLLYASKLEALNLKNTKKHSIKLKISFLSVFNDSIKL